MDLRDDLQKTLGTAYTLERELGGGGMSRVFVAMEASLGRRVVVKVLSPELAAGVSGGRFAREIRLAASLQQANIVPVLSAGETAGVPYYTMPFVEGLSLRARLSREGPLPIDDTLSVLRDIARALSYAHERGVVHRDIKPENVLLSGGAAVVTDFGIAKAISVARTLPPDTTITQVGTALGTPAYMAPEQGIGDPATDHRADVYSFGCVAYELLTGAPPFTGRTAQQLFVAHMSEPPKPVAAGRPDCPPDLAALVARCLEKDPQRRPESAVELLRWLGGVSTPDGRRRLGRRDVAVALVVAVAVVVGTYAAVTRARTPSDANAPKAVAVLPFINVGGDSSQEYLADGITDELATTLGKMPGIKIMSRTMTLRYKGRADVDAREVGRTLGVGYVLHGSVRRFADQLRVSAQLASAGDNSEVWSESYNRAAKDLFTLQEELTRAITSALRLRFATGAVPSGTNDPEAYDLYLRGRFLLARRGSGVKQAADNFEAAIAKDPSFARAYGALSEALMLLPYFSETPNAAVRDRAVTAARRALALDSTVAQAHIGLGLAAMHENRWSEAQAELRKAVALEPNEGTAHHQYGRVLIYTGAIDEALAEFQRAEQLEPSSAVYSGWVGSALAELGRFDESIEQFTRALQVDSTNGVALNMGALALIQAGHPDRALSLARRITTSGVFLSARLYDLAAAGDRAPVLARIRELEASTPRPWFGETALAFGYLGLGDRDRALAAFVRATDAGEFWPNFAPLCDRMFDPIRTDPRFAALVRRVGLDVQRFTSATGGRPR
jgi:TolB-like protein/Tfp pilus assembly protein PilF/tRNA A-37 threonylcarbamoyl transferase component Bud32